MLLELVLTSASSAFLTALYFKNAVKKYEICPVFNILTRVALEIRWKSISKVPDLAIAFIDIDKLKDANTLYGQAECNIRLRKALSVLRSSEKFHLSGRYFSGDEFVIIVPIDKIEMVVQRLQTSFKDNGLSATVGVTRYQNEKTLTEAVKRSNAIVEQLKASNIRGIVLYNL